jgi:hypothetical protein
VKFEGLKLLGAILAAIADQPTQPLDSASSSSIRDHDISYKFNNNNIADSPPSAGLDLNILQIAQMRDLLASIAALDEQRQCRELAEKYLQLLS